MPTATRGSTRHDNRTRVRPRTSTARTPSDRPPPVLRPVREHQRSHGGSHHTARPWWPPARPAARALSITQLAPRAESRRVFSPKTGWGNVSGRSGSVPFERKQRRRDAVRLRVPSPILLVSDAEPLGTRVEARWGSLRGEAPFDRAGVRARRHAADDRPDSRPFESWCSSDVVLDDVRDRNGAVRDEETLAAGVRVGASPAAHSCSSNPGGCEDRNGRAC